MAITLQALTPLCCKLNLALPLLHLIFSIQLLRLTLIPAGLLLCTSVLPLNTPSGQPLQPRFSYSSSCPSPRPHSGPSERAKRKEQRSLIVDKEKAIHTLLEAGFILQSNQQGSMGNFSCPPPKYRGNQNALAEA